jgi:cobyrinic acid a,c-diamide synthase
MPRALVIGGTASGVGKTTVTLGLLEALRRRGQRVQAFKVGPDFIDPAHHALVTGRPAYNLDAWMCGRAAVLACTARHAADADIVVVEGVMGCFDGADATGEDGSTAQIAKWLEAPVILVVDAAAQSRSAAAVVLGFERFDPKLAIGAVIVNRVAGAVHARWLREAIGSACRAPVVGALGHDAGLTLPERHLGLVTAAEGALTEERRAALAAAVERSVDVDRLLALASPLPVEVSMAAPPSAAPGTASGRRVRIGIARDAAFQFYYEENFERLRAAGAELCFWSPLSDPTLPDVDGLYLGGGYPELHGARLAANAGMRAAVREFAEAGRPIYAECGGLMYLASSLQDLDGVTHEMVGLLPAGVRMWPRRLCLGYTEVTFTAEAPLGAAGTAARGHEFHASTLEPVPPSITRVYRLRGGLARNEERAEGYLIGNALLSYVHLHFASNPALAERFVASCAR